MAKYIIYTGIYLYYFSRELKKYALLRDEAIFFKKFLKKIKKNDEKTGFS